MNWIRRWWHRIGYERCLRHGWVFTRGGGVCPICREYGYEGTVVE